MPTGSYERYRWSSYRATAGLEPAPDFLAQELVLELFGSDRESAIRSYRAFVRAGLGGSDPKAECLGEIYLADKGFVRRRRARTGALARGAARAAPTDPLLARRTPAQAK